jgi:hypothetical protein
MYKFKFRFFDPKSYTERVKHKFLIQKFPIELGDTEEQ